MFRQPAKEETAKCVEGEVEETVHVTIQPEMRRPKFDSKGPEWGGNDDLHPCWWIRRVQQYDPESEDANCELIDTETTHVFSSDFGSLNSVDVAADAIDEF